jgi:predicted TIM-barrel enzyme
VEKSFMTNEIAAYKSSIAVKIGTNMLRNRAIEGK